MAKHDEKIKQLLNKIDSENESLGTKPKISWNTNCIFRFDDNKHFNLNTINDPGYLVRALGFLLEKESTQGEAAKRLNVKGYKFDWKGYSINDWEEDFKLKAKIIAWNGKQKKLQALQKKLKDLRSEEARTGDALADIEKMLE